MIKHTYKFTTLDEAQAFINKYVQIGWFFSLPISVDGGFEVRRYLNHP